MPFYTMMIMQRQFAWQLQEFERIKFLAPSEFRCRLLKELIGRNRQLCRDWMRLVLIGVEQ
jgi:hypothetical protein